jgi:hypothetical protein
MFTGCRWGKENHTKVWLKCLQRIANPPYKINDKWYHLKRYPALLLLYAGGMASVLADKYDILRAILYEVNVRDDLDNEGPLGLNLLLYSKNVCNKLNNLIKKITEIDLLEKEIIPLSNRLFYYFNNIFIEYIPDYKEYCKIFNRFEILFFLVIFNLYDKKAIFSGHFAFHHLTTGGTFKEISNEFDKEKGNWLPIRTGLFEASEFNNLLKEFKDCFDKIHFNWKVKYAWIQSRDDWYK